MIEIVTTRKHVSVASLNQTGCGKFRCFCDRTFFKHVPIAVFRKRSRWQRGCLHEIWRLAEECTIASLCQSHYRQYQVLCRHYIRQLKQRAEHKRLSKRRKASEVVAANERHYVTFDIIRGRSAFEA